MYSGVKVGVGKGYPNLSKKTLRFEAMKKLSLALSLSILMWSCASRSERAAQYNDRIITTQKSIVDALVVMDSAFSDTNATMDWIDLHYASLQAQVKRSILALDSIGPFQEDPSFQLSARELFRSYEALVGIEYKKMVEIKLLPAESVNVAIVDSNLAIQERIFMQSNIAQERFYKAQEEFGKKYNLEFQ
jgi:hypothetical protein